ncbi:VOC family protein [Streptobacillus canis]|uniref:VOC family protein n=1 Tax=Streptobacillus canis TaxID=2678686 RepID=UPI0012E1CD45|nr:VOC family protein [Streptobacillus canis]
MEKIQRIHHISAIVGAAQENLDFYRNILNLRLIKRTVNFDDPNVYHLYFSNQKMENGTIMTFFPWENAHFGRKGSGQVGRIAFKIPKGSLEYWKNRLNEKNISFEESDLFFNKGIFFQDVHTLDLALVEGDEEADNNDIIGFYGSFLLSFKPEETANTLENDLGLEEVLRDDNYIHFKTLGEEKHHIIIPRKAAELGTWGVGTVHHIAWSVQNDEMHKMWQDYLISEGYGVTEVKDRNYFNAIYLKERGHIIFELATDTPGFGVDEPIETLGTQLKLPPQYEQYRDQIENNLKPLV